MPLTWQGDSGKASSPFPFSLQSSRWGLQSRGDTNMGKPVPCMAQSLEASRLLLRVFSVIRLLAIPWTVACQAPLSMEFSRQES